MKLAQITILVTLERLDDQDDDTLTSLADRVDTELELGAEAVRTAVLEKFPSVKVSFY